MSTTPVIPATPAPAAPAPAAPVSAAPTATPTPTPTAPATVPAGAGTPPATPGAGVPPSTPSGPQPPPRPDPSSFSDATAHYQADVQWQQDMESFKAANPDWKEPEAATTPTDAPTGETKAADAAGEVKPEEPKPADEIVPADGEEPFSIKDEPSLTPQALNDLIKGDEGLKKALDANPAAKSQLFKMAREHAELVQFKGIFPNSESATFARDTANRTVNLRNLFQMADGPEGMAKAFDSFMGEFAITGPDGKQVMDAQGNPVYGDDLYAFGEHVVDRYVGSSLEEVEERLKAGAYKSEVDKTRDEDMRIALSIIKDDLHPNANPPADPDLSSLTPDVRAQVQARLDEAKKIEAENAAKVGGAKKQNREAIRQQGTTEFFQRTAARMWPQVDGIIDKLRKAGAVIPDWQLTTNLPGTNVSAFKSEVGKRIEGFIKADPYISNHMLQLELQHLGNPTPETMQQRVAYFDQVLQQKDHTGRSMLNRVVSDIVHKYGTSVADGTPAPQPPASASREPRQGVPVRPHPLTQEEAWKHAEQTLAKEVDGWQNMSDAERMTYIFPRQRELLMVKR